MRLTAKGLHAALALIDRVDKVGSVRDMVALAVQVDGWVDHAHSIPLRSGEVHAEPGFPLGVHAATGQALWLLDGARLLVAPGGLATGAGTGATAGADSSAAVGAAVDATIYDLADAPIPREVIADQLRRGLLAAYVANLDLPEKSGPALQVAVGELLALAGDVEARSRGVLIEKLSEAIAAGPADHWAPLVLRIRTGFERALSDRHPPTVEAAVRALVRLAAVGPFPPGEPRAGARILTTLFNFPKSELHAATLAALCDLDDAVLQAVAPTVRPLADAALGSQDAEVRRLASDVELRLRGEARPGVGAAMLGGSSEEKARQLRTLGLDTERLIALLPRVLETLRDPEEAVRRAALEAADPVLSGRVGDPLLRRRVIEVLVESGDPHLLAAGIAAIDHPERPLAEDVALEALRSALDGPAHMRAGVAERLAARYARLPVDRAVDGFEGLLRHRDVTVREATLSALAALGAGQVRLRDLLTHAFMEQLRDPQPQARVAAGRAMLAMGFPNAPSIVVQSVVDADARVREGLVEALRVYGDPDRIQEAERLARDVDVVCRGTAAVEGDERLRWTAALGDIVERRGPRTVALLLAVLGTIPSEAVDPFLQFAVAEIDRHLIQLASAEAGGDSVLAMCRRLLEGPTPQPVHAARLAGERVTEDPQAFDFLWTMGTAGLPGHAAAARKALARLTQGTKSPAVMRAIAAAYWASGDTAQRDVLRGWYGAVPPLPRG
ncbi:MAG: hypothetical protein IPG72_02240 [Ardenticatenales bacterium]|jgi:hypothetical protein|nr:hypothetical protein [Ardenticatenales bacterium]